MKPESARPAELIRHSPTLPLDPCRDRLSCVRRYTAHRDGAGIEVHVEDGVLDVSLMFRVALENQMAGDQIDVALHAQIPVQMRPNGFW